MGMLTKWSGPFFRSVRTASAQEAMQANLSATVLAVLQFCWKNGSTFRSLTTAFCVVGVKRTAAMRATMACPSLPQAAARKGAHATSSPAVSRQARYFCAAFSFICFILAKIREFGRAYGRGVVRDELTRVFPVSGIHLTQQARAVKCFRGAAEESNNGAQASRLCPPSGAR